MKKMGIWILIISLLFNITLFGNEKKLDNVLKQAANLKLPVKMTYNDSTYETRIIKYYGNIIELQDDSKTYKINTNHIEKIILMKNNSGLEIRVGKILNIKDRIESSGEIYNAPGSVDGLSPMQQEYKSRNARTALLASCLYPGGGQFVNGDIGKAIAIFLISAASTTFSIMADENLMWIFIGIGTINQIASWIDAYKSGCKIPPPKFE
ncbi:MAG: hypothetical protein R6U11_01160 [Bacteroidales bacterium]